MYEIYLLFFIIFFTLAMFIWGYFRYDTVALMSLISLVLLGIIPSEQAFTGFSNPAVITVAAVMVITAAIGQTGFVEWLLKLFEPFLDRPFLHIGLICLLAAALSAFMNNVGALSLMMPIAIQSALKAKLSPSKILMPLSFATVLGGMTTKIGTPPNLLISAYKEQVTGSSFTMFDFTPVGLSVAITSLFFIALIGWRLVPARRSAEKYAVDMYQIQDYTTEIIIPQNSPVVGMERHQLEELIEGDFAVLGLIRGRKKRLVIAPHEELQAGDIVIIQATHDDLSHLISIGRLELAQGDVVSPENLLGEEITTSEAVVTFGSRIVGHSWQQLRIRSKLGVNLLAIARSGKALKNRLNHVNLNPGDVVLVQGSAEYLRENIISLGLVPLVERVINVGFNRSTLIPLCLFLLGILLASTQILAIDVSFVLVVILLVGFKLIPMRQVYQSIDWSIIVLLGALIPLGNALISTGAAKLIGEMVVTVAGTSSPLLILGILLLVTMTLSDIMNNVATAVIMAPIAVNIAQLMDLSVDPFLMTIAIGASCSFLTPISHQNNTLVMGPGGYKFFDYLWLGIPIELMVLITALPFLYYFWLI
ncbi:SLC13 family permease [Legionella pneumophila]|uniref:SLC13 family permease n=1 Tax=Legionella pneumophila TaxID=446 RepID=UPI0010A9E9F2|nr:SLC13 family permease [Legionella pneumophila]TIE33508.1 SLC13 family permease [Legionella pneumophila]